MYIRIMQIVTLALILVVATAGMANADWWVDLTCTDNPLGPTGSNFEVRYHENGGETDIWTVVGFYLETHGAPGPADVTVTACNDPTSAFNGWFPLDISDTGPGAKCSMMSFATPDPADGDLIFSCDYGVPLAGNVEWDQGPGDFMANIGGVDYDWADFTTGDHLYVNGILATPPEDEFPAPPIPEIITIALLAIGLLSIGVFFWYRQQRKTCSFVTC